jgi:putative phage-type endonuclease
MEQRSPEWYAARLGKVTASRVADVMAKTKSGYGASRANYMAELLCERLTGQKTDSFVSAEMQRGTELEAQARDGYALLNDVKVGEGGFFDHASIPMFGASPDGLIGTDGLVEFKCPNTATHIDYLLSQSVPGKYQTQMQAQMACTGRAWCDFVSFDPRLPDNLQFFVKRVQRDDAFIAAMLTEIAAFLAELSAKELQLRNLAKAA